MIAFGRDNAFPFTLGDDESLVANEESALLDALSPVFDATSENTAHYQEVFATATPLGALWELGTRLSNQAIPERMLEALTTWETATNTRPTVGSLDTERRRAVAGKLRGIAGNALADIEDAARRLLGPHFVALHLVRDVDRVFYWPGGHATPSGSFAPGPPGLEWSSNVATVRIQVAQLGLPVGVFRALTQTLEQTLDAIVPGWMTFSWNTGSGFSVGESLIGEQAL